MRIHPREQPAQMAATALVSAIYEWMQAHPDLTTSEVFAAVIEAHHSVLARMIRDEIRIERHGTTDKPGGLE